MRTSSAGEKKTTTSPRRGPDHSITRQSVNGTLRPYASLFTKMRSPCRMVGCMEPVGTSFQSATADRNDPTTIRMTRNGLPISRQNFNTRAFNLAAVIRLIGYACA